MKKFIYLTVSLLLLILQQTTAQNGKANIKMEIHELDYENMTVSMDIFIKARDASSTFNLAEQNYRMSFEREVVGNPVIIEEFLSGDILLPDSTYALYNPHTLGGSIDTIISYNIELAEGAGVLVTEDEWLPIGRLGFDILDSNECIRIFFHDESIYPSTYIVEFYEGTLYGLDDINSTGLVCSGSLPLIAANDHVNMTSNQVISYNILNNDYVIENDAIAEIGPHFGSFQLLSSPPVSQITITETTNPGELNLQATQGFVGNVMPFEYEVCNTADQCATAEVFVTVNMATNTTSPYHQSNIRLFPTAARNYINVEYLNISPNPTSPIIITDTNGCMVFQINELTTETPVHQFDISTLPQGIYFFNTAIQQKWVTKKFIKM